MKTQLDLLKDFLTFFASPADQQLEYLRRRDKPPELFIAEFAAAYEDLASGVLDMLERGELEGHQCYLVKKLSDWLRELRAEDDPSLWTADALHSAWQWASVRGMAQDCLRLFVHR